MKRQMKLFSVAAAMLYVGPLLAGFSAAPIAVLPVFVAIFVLWMTLMRPSVWAKATADGTPLALAARLGLVALVQVLLVIVAFGVGRGLAGLVGVLEMQPWLPVLISLLAVPVGRILWNPAIDSAETKAFLDSAIREIERKTGEGPRK
ncbi:MAG: hypothetical protein RLZZ528_573 [Pseudomonadota bacterium]